MADRKSPRTAGSPAAAAEKPKAATSGFWAKRDAKTGRFVGGASESNELVRGMGLKPLKGRMGPRLVY